MELQKTFKDSYITTLKDQVKSGVAIPLYGQDAFEVDETQVKRLAAVYAPEGLREKMLQYVNDDFMGAKTLYEAYSNISPLLASNESFWAYLTHTTLFKYMQQRWSNVLDGTSTSNYILDHWFVSSQGLIRNALANLWWNIHNTIDSTREDPYELSEIVFKNYTLRTMTFGISTLIRHREAMIGILEFLKENPTITAESFENRGRFIVKYFNRLGAVKQLAYLERDYFKTKCESMKEKILSISTRDQVVNDESLYND
ncbi:DUF6339 family protein [Prevotella histicola]|uniref:DUF6339 family protein n=1 Tax=Prevotella histicola TaxID=470565 RepID=UPI0028EA8040|nr:DUF6339 family protein [Prevotella histicola]